VCSFAALNHRTEFGDYLLLCPARLILNTVVREDMEDPLSVSRRASRRIFPELRSTAIPLTARPVASGSAGLREAT
jgi:hypothetical protein